MASESEADTQEEPAGDAWGDEGGAAAEAWGDDSGGGWGDEGGGDSAFGEPAFTLNGSLTLQGGVFVPLLSDRFEAHENEAYITTIDGRRTLISYDQPCDPVAQPHQPCYSYDHGQEPGSLSIGRATLLLEAHYQPDPRLAVHAIVRGVRSMKLVGDRYAQIPITIEEFNAEQRKDYAQDWVHDNYYTELDLREFYLDVFPSDWLHMRLGRQQVAWGETSSFRLLDVVNPSNTVWHFGPLESFEDTRIPLWMANVTLDIEALRGALEMLWVPLLDRPQDTVTVPLTFGGAWGLPYTNAPTTFFAPRRIFQYPGGKISDSRAGVRWKGDLGRAASYSLVYYYTHQINLPIPTHFVYGGTNAQGVRVVDQYYLHYPRNHVAGATLEYALPSPIGTTLRLEASVVPNNVIPSRTDQGFTPDPRDPTNNTQVYAPKEKLAASYAVSLQRSTMIRFLNPTQSFLIFAQFSHTLVPSLDVGPDRQLRGEDRNLVQVPLYNLWQAQEHSFAVVGMMRTTYLHGVISPRVTGAWLPNLYAGDSGFVSVDVDFRLSNHASLNIRGTDFIGKDPYRELGLFRDRDELHAALTIQY